MKKPHVLNRSMFNQGGTSAYGKGITSNLVSDEQRQRFNYGGRVGFAHGLSALGTVNPYLNEKDWYSYDKEPWNTIERTIPIKSDLYSTASSQTDDDVMNEWGPLVEGVEVEDLFPSLGSGKRQVEKDKAAQERFESAQERFYPKEILEAEVEEAIPPPLPTDTDSDVLGAGIDWEKFAEGLYDKKGARGKAMLGLAGNVLAASQLPKKEAAVLLGKGMGEFGKTWAERKEKMEDIAATGKMYEKVNVAKAEAAGQAAIDLEMIKQGISGSDRSQFKTFYSKNLKVDEGLAGVIGFKPKAAPLTKEKKLDVAALKEAAPGSVFKDGNMYILVTEEGIDTDNNAFQIMAKYGRWQRKKTQPVGP